MSLKYKLITRKVSDLKGGPKVDKVFASPNYGGYTELDDVCKLISERSALSSADVKGVLDSLNYVLDMQLRAGMIVKMGELGNFRMSFSSAGADPKTPFAVSSIRTPRVLFTPGAALKKARMNVNFLQAKDIVNADQPESAPPEEGGENLPSI